MSVSVEQMADEIAKMLTEYETAIVKNVDTSGKAVADKGAKQLRQTSPKRTGKYAKSWGVTREEGAFGENAKYIIHNKTLPCSTSVGTRSRYGKWKANKGNPAH